MRGRTVAVGVYRSPSPSTSFFFGVDGVQRERASHLGKIDPKPLPFHLPRTDTIAFTDFCKRPIFLPSDYPSGNNIESIMQTHGPIYAVPRRIRPGRSVTDNTRTLWAEPKGNSCLHNSNTSRLDRLISFNEFFLVKRRE